MSGNITLYDVDVMLKQMEAMKKKIVLLLDYNGPYDDHFAILKVPVLTYSTRTEKVTYVDFE